MWKGGSCLLCAVAPPFFCCHMLFNPVQPHLVRLFSRQPFIRCPKSANVRTLNWHISCQGSGGNSLRCNSWLASQQWGDQSFFRCLSTCWDSQLSLGSEASKGSAAEYRYAVLPPRTSSTRRRERTRVTVVVYSGVKDESTQLNAEIGSSHG